MDQNPFAGPEEPKSDAPKDMRSDHSAIRQSFRVAVGPEDGILAVLNGEKYPVADISPEGINVFCRDTGEFALSQVIEKCELIIPEDTVINLTARVIHCSFGTGGKWKVGIQWVGLADADLDKIVRQVSKIKDKLRRLGQESQG